MGERGRERIERCLEVASALKIEADRCGDRSVAAAYLELAQGWLKLASDEPEVSDTSNPPVAPENQRVP